MLLALLPNSSFGLHTVIEIVFFLNIRQTLLRLLYPSRWDHLVVSKILASISLWFSHIPQECRLNPLQCCFCYSVFSICMPRICLRNRVYVVVVAMAIERYEKERNVSIVHKDNLRFTMMYSEHWIKRNCHMRVCTYHKLPRYSSHNCTL
jgi:hypothetical protein